MNKNSINNHLIRLVNLVNNKPPILCFISGLLSALVFAPTFFFPLITCLGILSYHIKISTNWQRAAKLGFYFGFGHFISSIHWVSFALLNYISDLWWLLPFSILGLPCILSIFIAGSSALAYLFRRNFAYDLYFAISWVLFEWLRSWIFTGFPWNLLGYSLCFCTTIIQIASLIGILGLSFIVAYIASSFRYFYLANKSILKQKLTINFLILVSMYGFGCLRLNYFNNLGHTDLTLRLVQANIKQTEQSNIHQFIDNLKAHIDLSYNTKSTFHPQIIVWPESSIPTFINNRNLLQIISTFLTPDQILIAGSMRQIQKHEYVGMYGINYMGEIIFGYNKIHLVPFGEYLPLKKILPFKLGDKITKFLAKIIDFNYTKGAKNQIIQTNNLRIKPLVCYESIFANEVKISNSNIDLLLSITNDNWFGHSAGPYQHFYISQLRAIENGLPLIIAANNGISAVIDPLGRIISRTNINEISYLDSYVPNKLPSPTLYCSYNELIIICILIIIVFIIEKPQMK